LGPDPNSRHTNAQDPELNQGRLSGNKGFETRRGDRAKLVPYPSTQVLVHPPPPLSAEEGALLVQQIVWASGLTQSSELSPH